MTWICYLTFKYLTLVSVTSRNYEIPLFRGLIHSLKLTRAGNTEVRQILECPCPFSVQFLYLILGSVKGRKRTGSKARSERELWAK